MPFKLAFVASFIFAATVATMTARRAARRHGAAVNQLANEVRALLFIRGALGIVFYAMLIAWFFWPNRLAWAYVPIPANVRWLAMALRIPVLAFFAWSFAEIGTNYRGGDGLYDDHELVTTGPYGWVKHPIYFAFIAIMLLVFPLSANWLLTLSGLLLVVSIAVIRIPIEEHELHERFDAKWEEYRKRQR